ncbi:NADH:flavin oxidoreductase 2 [Leucogyrophana mollusca]|uniref:NADH:flavin oxidoreductase 2 n=1 Tax=Leucogyrophana mollusca TaxID=85980 RepID=A0ACB8BWN5_9AGAM|nr:NADH:flavin oxidoreductase 2 [Leucogyrophana mollusca]
MANLNRGVDVVDGYFPLNDPEIGSAYTNIARTAAYDVFPRNATPPVLFQPLTIRGTTFKNRIWVSPMCQYSSDNGHATDWHLVHLGGYASRGVGAIVIEATSVVPEGRISPEDAGLWTDSQIAPLKRIVNFAHSQGTKIGVQLAHAGRKASTLAPWVASNAAGTHKASTRVAQANEGGWPDDVYGPSNIPFASNYPQPKAMTKADIEHVEDAFVSAVERCKIIGFDFIEIHGAHGYLIHSFLSPLSNDRKDEYGGELANRLRFPLRVAQRVREAWGDKPLFVRISATDWAEGPELGDDGVWKQWGLEQSKIFVGELHKLGVDLIDTSSGGNWEKQNFTLCNGYQVPFAEALKSAYPQLAIGAVGLIVDPHQAESYLKDGKADVVFLARELMRDPHWALTAARALGVAVKPANQYERCWPEMLAPAK